MSIWPVKLSEWFPLGDAMYENATMMVSVMRCVACGRRCKKYKKAIGHHSLPWGYGDMWCSEKCFKSNKVARPDKRRLRRFRRKFKDLEVKVST